MTIKMVSGKLLIQQLFKFEIEDVESATVFYNCFSQGHPFPVCNFSFPREQ